MLYTSVPVHEATAQGSGLRLSPRDRQVVELVGRFRLLAAEQIRAVLFAEQTSKTPLDRVLKRLTGARYLARLGRMVGGYGGGSGQYVYQLGRAGWVHLKKGGGYRPLRVVDHHALAIADCFVTLAHLERGGECTVLRYDADPVSRRTVGDTLLTPDAFMEIGVQAIRQKFAFWLEIDRDTENADVIRGKCSRYWRAYKAWDGDVFPYVVFVVPDEPRRRELERIIAGGPDAAQGLFRVCTFDGLADVVRALWAV
jgi:Replication-relaxation